MSLIPNGLAKSAAEAGFYTHPINQSLRLNDNDSAYLSWTPASAGNRKTFTQSFWMKRGNIGSNQKIWTAGSSGTEAGIQFYTGTGNDAIEIYQYNSGYNLQLDTSQLFRDTSSWYHIVVAWDTTQATASDRVKLYVNGEQVTAFSTSTYPSQNLDTFFNSTSYTNYIGWLSGSTSEFDGYLAEVHFIDGQALDASSFGETKSGVWIPKAYSGSHGTNGFYLDFGNSGSIGADVSGNGNNFTANNLAATDVVLDSPTNNFATLNPLENITTWGHVLSEGNLKLNAVASHSSFTDSTIGFTSGKWYTEIWVGATYASYYPDIAIRAQNGVGNASISAQPQFNASGTFSLNGSPSASSYTTGDIIQFAVDADNGKLFIGKNGTWYNSGVPASGTGHIANIDMAAPIFFGSTPYATNSPVIYNFGQDSSFAGNKTAQGNTDANGYGDFYYAPPTGYLALCTANLEVPDAMNPALDASPQDYFNTVLWSGDGTTTGVYINGVGFQPDLVWAKQRNGTGYPILTDVLRGNQKFLFSNATDAEFTSLKRIEDFQADGFNAEDDFYQSGQTYVAWNWKANGSGVSNTDGSITSTVSANTDAGVSILTYTTPSSGTFTVGHGLNQAPEMCIAKSRSNTYGWGTYHVGIGATKYLVLNTTEYAQTGTLWNNTTPTDSVVSINSSNSGTNLNYVMYAFHSVEGFSKFGSYTGNGSTDGTFVYTGFRPAFVLVKGSSHTSNWNILDAKRDPYNLESNRLRPNLSDAEASTSSGTYAICWDAVSNGFKLRGGSGTNDVNQTSETYIYMAFAENPFKYANAR